MVKVFKVIALAAGVALAALAANASTVAVGGTGSNGAGGFTVTEPAGMVDTSNGAYTSVATTPVSDWVWIADPVSDHITYDFTFTFDLTGYDASTAALAGVWGVDNSGTVDLNGTQVAFLDFGYPAFQTMTAFDDTGATFVAGVNTLTFHATNSGGPGAFRASVMVTADVAPVPLPASLPLLAVALAGLGYTARRKRNV